MNIFQLKQQILAFFFPNIFDYLEITQHRSCAIW